MFKLFGKRKRELEQLEEEFERFKACVEERDFLMETGFTTTITDKKLLEELRKTTFNGYSFAEVKEQIFNFDFRNINRCTSPRLTGQPAIGDLQGAAIHHDGNTVQRGGR